MDTITLKGSERAAAHGARRLSAADPAQGMQVTVIVRRRAQQSLQARVAALSSATHRHEYLTREEFADRHGADASDLKAVRAFAAAQDLTVILEHAARRTVILSGSVAQFSAAFGVQLHRMEQAGGTYRGRTGAIRLPAHLDGIVEAVLGLDDRPQAKTHCRIRPPDSVKRRPGAAAPVRLENASSCIRSTARAGAPRAMRRDPSRRESDGGSSCRRRPRWPRAPNAAPEIA